METHPNAKDGTALQLLRPRACAAALGVSVTTLWRWSKSRGFPVAYRLGANSVAFDAGEVRLWLATRRVRTDALND